MLLYLSVLCTFSFIFYILCNIILIMFSIPVYYNNIINHDDRLPGGVFDVIMDNKICMILFLQTYKN